MPETAWIDWLKLAGLAGAPLLILGWWVYHQNKVVLPALLERQDRAIEAQRQDFLKAQEGRDTAENARQQQLITAFDARTVEGAKANQLLVETICMAYGRDFDALRKAIQTHGDLVLSIYRDPIHEPEELTAEDRTRHHARGMAEARRLDNERGH